MIIDLERIVAAEKYYLDLGYEKTDVPWIVDNEAYRITKPASAGRDFITLDGNLVASGEQSFIQMMLDNNKFSNKAQCTTPCFRDEKNYDNLHHKYFMKVELIEIIDKYEVDFTGEDNFGKMVQSALSFFNQFLPVKAIFTALNAIDIIDAKYNIELGSYGIREYKDLKWIYGTGLAEPRLTQALAAEWEKL